MERFLPGLYICTPRVEKRIRLAPWTDSLHLWDLPSGFANRVEEACELLRQRARKANRTPWAPNHALALRMQGEILPRDLRPWAGAIAAQDELKAAQLAGRRLRAALRHAEAPPPEIPEDADIDAKAEMSDLLKRQEAVRRKVGKVGAKLAALEPAAQANRAAAAALEAAAEALEAHENTRPANASDWGIQLSEAKEYVQDTERPWRAWRREVADLTRRERITTEKLADVVGAATRAKEQADEVAERMRSLGKGNPICPIDLTPCPCDWQERRRDVKAAGRSLKTQFEAAMGEAAKIEAERQAIKARLAEITGENDPWKKRKKAQETILSILARQEQLKEWNAHRRELIDAKQLAEQRKEESPMPAGYALLKAELTALHDEMAAIEQSLSSMRAARQFVHDRNRSIAATKRLMEGIRERTPPEELRRLLKGHEDWFRPICEEIIDGITPILDRIQEGLSVHLALEFYPTGGIRTVLKRGNLPKGIAGYMGMLAGLATQIYIFGKASMPSGSFSTTAKGDMLRLLSNLKRLQADGKCAGALIGTPAKLTPPPGWAKITAAQLADAEDPSSESTTPGS